MSSTSPAALLGTRLVRGCLPLAVLLALALAFPSAGQQPSSAEVKAAFKKLSDRMAGPSADKVRLRQDLIEFRVRYPGSPEAPLAAELLARLPSPLDKLSPSTIPELEKFAWQPKELVGVLGEHRGRHAAPVSCVAVSPDSSLVASGGSAYVRLWDSNTMRLKATLVIYSGVTTIAFSKDGKALAAGTSYGGVYVWDIAKPAEPVLRHQVSAATSPVYSVAFHPSGKSVAAGCFDNHFRVYDVSGKKAETLAEVVGHEKAVQAVAYAPDGKQLATGSADGTVKLWGTADNAFKEQAVLSHPAAVTCLAFPAGGKTLASGCADGGVRLWHQPTSSKPLPRVTIPIAKTAVTSMSFSASGNTLAITVGDAFVHLWSLAGGKFREINKLEGHAGVATSVAYAPDMRILVSGGQDWTVRTWDLRKPKVVERFVPWSHLSHVYSVAFATDGGTLASGSEDRVVRFWDLTRSEPKTRNFLKGDSVPVYSVAYSPDGKLVAAGGAHTTVRQWDATTGRPRPACNGNEGRVEQLVYSPDGKYLFSRTGKQVLLFDPNRGQVVRQFADHETLVASFALSPDGRRLLTGSGSYLYDKDGKIVLKDGSYVYTDCKVRLWDVHKAEIVQAVEDFKTPVYGVAFSGDGRELFAGAYQAGLRRWDCQKTPLTEGPALKTSADANQGLLPTPDGKMLFTRGSYGMLYLWELESGKKVKEWAFQEAIGGVALLDGRHLAVGLGTGVIYILRLAPVPAGN
jgi:WD40 repeat protein